MHYCLSYKFQGSRVYPEYKDNHGPLLKQPLSLRFCFVCFVFFTKKKDIQKVCLQTKTNKAIC